MIEGVDIHKAGGIIIRDRCVLVERSKGKEFFIAPGGSLEDGETAEQALVRELREEFRIAVEEDDLEYFDNFKAAAAGQEDKVVRMDMYMVNKWRGEPLPDNEVEELRWISSKTLFGLKVGSIMLHDVIPLLVEMGLID